MASPEQLPVPPDQTASQQPLVLVIEDEALIALSVEQILTEAGYDVLVAFSGEEALGGEVPIERLAAVVSDIRLAYGIDGRSVLSKLRAMRPSLPAVMVTGFGQWIHEADLRGLGGPTARLTKPFAAEELIACIGSVLTSTDGRLNRRSSRGRAGDPDDPAR